MAVFGPHTDNLNADDDTLDATAKKTMLSIGLSTLAYAKVPSVTWDANEPRPGRCRRTAKTLLVSFSRGLNCGLKIRTVSASDGNKRFD